MPPRGGCKRWSHIVLLKCSRMPLRRGRALIPSNFSRQNSEDLAKPGTTITFGPIDPHLKGLWMDSGHGVPDHLKGGMQLSLEKDPPTGAMITAESQPDPITGDVHRVTAAWLDKCGNWMLVKDEIIHHHAADCVIQHSDSSAGTSLTESSSSTQANFSIHYENPDGSEGAASTQDVLGFLRQLPPGTTYDQLMDSDYMSQYSDQIDHLFPKAEAGSIWDFFDKHPGLNQGNEPLSQSFREYIRGN